MKTRKVTALEERILAQVRTWTEQQGEIDAEFTGPDARTTPEYDRAYGVVRDMGFALMRLGKQYAKVKR